MQPQVTTRYRVAAITQHQFHLTDKEPGYFIPAEQINFQVSFSLDWKPEVKQIVCRTLVRYNDKRNEESLLLLDLSVSFLIENYHEIIKHEGDKTETPDALMLAIFDTTLDTIRGVLFVRAENTFLSHTIFGTINPATFLKRVKDYPEGDGTIIKN